MPSKKKSDGKPGDPKRRKKEKEVAEAVKRITVEQIRLLKEKLIEFATLVAKIKSPRGLTLGELVAIPKKYAELVGLAMTLIVKGSPEERKKTQDSLAQSKIVADTVKAEYQRQINEIATSVINGIEKTKGPNFFDSLKSINRALTQVFREAGIQAAEDLGAALRKTAKTNKALKNPILSGMVNDKINEVVAKFREEIARRKQK